MMDDIFRSRGIIHKIAINFSSDAPWGGVDVDSVGSTTVPIPASIFLLASGVLAIVGFARRKKTA